MIEKHEMPSKEQDNMKALTKTFDILDIFLHGQEELSVTEMARMLGLNKTTVSRIMLRLEKRGYLKQIEKRGKYSLGTIFLEFSGIIKSRLKIRDIAIPHLYELSRRVQESTILAVWDGRRTVITESFHDLIVGSPLKVVPDEGISMPLYCTCLGKIFLASMSDDDLREYLEDIKLEQRTPKTIIDPQKLSQQVARIRQEGVALDDEEYAVGVRGIAAGLYNADGKAVGSIGILAPSARMSIGGMQQIGPPVKDSAMLISKQLGYREA
jgi:IclR family transcriptional regulator, KDG regulon repressor